MSNEMQMVPVQVVTEVSDRQPQEQPPTNPLVVIHRLLRGRYIWATLLATLLGAAGVYAGMTLVKPLYASRGLINVRQNVAPILYQTELAGMLPAFSSFVETQASYLQSQRVIDQALQNPEWRALGRGLSPKAVSDFTDALTVQVPKGSAMIQVSFVDEDPVAARLAVRAVIQAYRALYGDSETEDIAQRMQILEDRRTALNNQHKSLKDRVQQMAHEYGSAALERMYDHSLKEVQSLETELRRIQLAIAIAEGAQEAIVDAPALPQVDLAASDPRLRELTRQQEDLHREVELLRFRYGDSHTKVSEKAHERLLVEQAIEQRKEELAKQDPAMVFNPEGASLADLRSREQRVSRLYQAAKAETVELGRKNLLIQTLESEADMVQKRLEETNNRIEHLTVESAASGRIEVVSMGDPPLRPEKDKRKQMAAVGGLGGFGFGIGVFLLLGLLNRKMRSIEDARQGLGNTVRLLGTMPTLPNELIDPEDIATAAYCVHQIRGLLQMHKEAADRRVIAITSPTANDGKTTLTLALAISFATARSRVLMIDCDLVGGGLSSRVNRSVHRKIGKILQRRGLLTPEELKQMLELTTPGILNMHYSGRPLGQVLVDEGYLTDVQLAEALSAQSADHVGLLDALNGEPLDEVIAETGIKGVSILPLGRANVQHIGEISPASLRRVLREAREQFDVVLIDTGPVLGSLEAALVAAEADETVLTLSRGTSRSLAERALEQLRIVGATVAGTVFNRATPQDLLMSGFSSTRSMRSVDDRTIIQVEHMPRLGPVAAALVNSGVAGDEQR